MVSVVIADAIGLQLSPPILVAFFALIYARLAHGWAVADRTPAMRTA